MFDYWRVLQARKFQAITGPHLGPEKWMEPTKRWPCQWNLWSRFTPWMLYSRSNPNVKLEVCYLIGGIPTTPLKNDGVKVSWDDEIPNWMVESHEIPWFQSPPISYVYQFSDFVGPHPVSQGLSQLKPISSATFEAHEAPLGLPLRYPFNSASSGKMLGSETFLFGILRFSTQCSLETKHEPLIDQWNMMFHSCMLTREYLKIWGHAMEEKNNPHWVLCLKKWIHISSFPWPW